MASCKREMSPPSPDIRETSNNTPPLHSSPEVKKSPDSTDTHQTSCLMFEMLPVELIIMILREATCVSEDISSRLPGLDVNEGYVPRYPPSTELANHSTRGNAINIMTVCRLFYNVVRELFYAQLDLMSTETLMHMDVPLPSETVMMRLRNLRDGQLVYEEAEDPFSTTSLNLNLCKRALVVQPYRHPQEDWVQLDEWAERDMQSRILQRLPNLRFLQIMVSNPVPDNVNWPEWEDDISSISEYLRNAPNVKHLVIDNMRNPIHGHMDMLRFDDDIDLGRIRTLVIGGHYRFTTQLRPRSMEFLRSIELSSYTDSPRNLVHLLQATSSLSAFSITIRGTFSDNDNNPPNFDDDDTCHPELLREALLPHARSLKSLKIIYKPYDDHYAGDCYYFPKIPTNPAFPPLDRRHVLDLAGFVALRDLWLEPNVLDHRYPPPGLETFTWGLDRDLPAERPESAGCRCGHLHGCWNALRILDFSPVQWTRDFVKQAKKLGIPLRQVNFEHKVQVWPKGPGGFQPHDCLCWNDMAEDDVPWGHFDRLGGELWNLGRVRVGYSYGVGQREALVSLIREAKRLREEASSLRLLESPRWSGRLRGWGSSWKERFYDRLGVMQTCIDDRHFGEDEAEDPAILGGSSCDTIGCHSSGQGW